MKIAFLGDIALIGKYNLMNNSNAKLRLKKISNKLEEYDYVIANLESPLTSENKTLICKSMHLRSPMINIEILNYLGIDAVTLANNHIYDYGEKGFNDTINILEENNIDWFGVNSKSLNLKIDKERISFSGFVCYTTNGVNYRKKDGERGVNLLSYDNLMNQLIEDKKNNLFSIMLFHWGDEHTNYPRYEHIKLAKNLAKRKNIVIVGHHPHVIQGIQEYKNSLIVYSLGNFLFDDCKSINNNFELTQTEKNRKSFILEVEIKNNEISDFEYNGFKDKDGGIEFFDIKKEINNISSELKNINSFSEYNERRKKQREKELKNKFGERDFSWLKSRLNYYSIGAFLFSKLRKFKYKKEKKKFLLGVKDEE